MCATKCACRGAGLFRGGRAIARKSPSRVQQGGKAQPSLGQPPGCRGRMPRDPSKVKPTEGWPQGNRILGSEDLLTVVGAQVSFEVLVFDATAASLSLFWRGSRRSDAARWVLCAHRRPSRPSKQSKTLTRIDSLMAQTRYLTRNDRPPVIPCANTAN